MIERTFQRKNWIDICRAFAIFFVVWGHVVQPETERFNHGLITLLRNSVYSFHMPLFFFISGICFRPMRYLTSKDFIKVKFKSIIFPCYLCMLFMLIYNTVFYDFDIINYCCSIEIIKSIFLFNGAEYVYWYLGALFVVECLMYLLTKKLNKKRVLISVVLIYAFFSLYQFVKYPLPFSANAGFVCIPFFYTGFLLSDFNFERIRNIHCIIGLMLGSLVCLIINAVDNKYIVSIWCGVIANPVTFLIKAYSGIITISCLSLLTDRILSNNMVNHFSFLGKNTLYVYAFNRLAISYFEDIKKHVLQPNCPLLDVVNLGGSVIIVLIIFLFQRCVGEVMLD